MSIAESSGFIRERANLSPPQPHHVVPISIAEAVGFIRERANIRPPQPHHVVPISRAEAADFIRECANLHPPQPHHIVPISIAEAMDISMEDYLPQWLDFMLAIEDQAPQGWERHPSTTKSTQLKQVACIVSVVHQCRDGCSIAGSSTT